MKIQFLKYLERIRTSFWFLPSVMTIGAAALAYGMVHLDRYFGHELPESLSWAYTGGAEGASSVLGTVAGSMITLAGVVFSLTLVSLSLASSQFGPRLLRNFMRDTTNQITIGTFVATFIYCLLVLRTIRRLDDATFVPELSVTVGVLFALTSLGVLIFFIHHVAISIQADEIISRVSHELLGSIDKMFPEHLGDAVGAPDMSFLPASFPEEAVAIKARGDGYLEFIDGEVLMKLAEENDVVMRVEHRPGHYVIEGVTLLFVHPRAHVNDELVGALRGAFVLGTRTSAQDIEFTLKQLVEIAVRALSPGVNDPFTAITCIDRLGSALCRLAQREMPSPYRRGQHGKLRIAASATTFADLLAAAFNQIRQNSASSTAVTIRLLEVIAEIAAFTRRGEDIDALQQQADMILQPLKRLPLADEDRRDIEERHARACEALVRASQPHRGATEIC